MTVHPASQPANAAESLQTERELAAVAPELAAATHGLRASRLAGLHIHFFLKSLELARPGDYGAYMTAAEWLDVNYGSVLRHALADGLGGLALHLLSPTAEPFPDALTSAAITCWEAGHHGPSVAVRSVERADRLDGLRTRRSVPWSTLCCASSARRPTTRCCGSSAKCVTATGNDEENQ